MIVLDANILIRAVLGRRVRQLIETYGVRGARFFALEVAFDDAAIAVAQGEMSLAIDERIVAVSVFARFAGDDFHHLAVLQRPIQGHEPAIHLGADAAVANLGVDAIGKVERRRACG